MRTLRHMVINVKGVLNWKDKELKKLFKGGSASEIRGHLHEKLIEGYRVIPFGKECEGFDKVNGCPGHPIEE